MKLNKFKLILIIETKLSKFLEKTEREREREKVLILFQIPRFDYDERLRMVRGLPKQLEALSLSFSRFNYINVKI